jgi:hypothetical protein
MKTGMLWFDDDPKRSIAEKVERAAQRYREKYGVAPDLCYANPISLADSPESVQPKAVSGGVGKVMPRITVKHARSILPNHFWLGVAD